MSLKRSGFKRAVRGLKSPVVKSKPKKGKKVPRGKSIGSLTKKLDSLFSKKIRLKYADKEGNVSCYTCDRVYQVSCENLQWK